jgi:hypothetical protein
VSRFIDEQRGRFGVEPSCVTLGVSASAYYQRASGERSARSIEGERLLERIRALQAANYHAYGYRGSWKALRREGVQGRPRPRQAADADSRHSGRQAARQAVEDHQSRSAGPAPARSRRARLLSRRAEPALGRRPLLPQMREGLMLFAFVLDAYRPADRRVGGCHAPAEIVKWWRANTFPAGLGGRVARRARRIGFRLSAQAPLPAWNRRTTTVPTRAGVRPRSCSSGPAPSRLCARWPDRPASAVDGARPHDVVRLRRFSRGRARGASAPGLSARGAVRVRALVSGAFSLRHPDLLLRRVRRKGGVWRRRRRASFAHGS